MATVTRENIGLLNDKITVKVEKQDYFPSFEQAIKGYSKKANIPGFRKGMVPAGMIKKMYGQSVFTEEVIRSVEKELGAYLTSEKLEIFAQPLPLAQNDKLNFDFNAPGEYDFAFEIGLKPSFEVADPAKASFKNYKVTITDAMIDEEVKHIQDRFGKPVEKPEPVLAEGEENANTEAAAPVERIPAALDETLFKAVFPDKEITTEEAFRATIKEELEKAWENQSKGQLQDQLYHYLLDNTQIEFPESFLKRWMENSDKQPKTEAQIAKEYPSFVNSLKWSLIIDKISKDINLEIKPEEIRNVAKMQLMGYFGNMNIADDAPWMDEYLNKVMKDEKFITDTYYRIQTDKVFEYGISKASATDTPISMEDFTKMQQEHQHHH